VSVDGCVAVGVLAAAAGAAAALASRVGASVGGAAARAVPALVDRADVGGASAAGVSGCAFAGAPDLAPPGASETADTAPAASAGGVAAVAAEDVLGVGGASSAFGSGGTASPPAADFFTADDERGRFAGAFRGASSAVASGPCSIAAAAAVGSWVAPVGGSSVAVVARLDPPADRRDVVDLVGSAAASPSPGVEVDASASAAKSSGGGSDVVGSADFLTALRLRAGDASAVVDEPDSPAFVVAGRLRGAARCSEAADSMAGSAGETSSLLTPGSLLRSTHRPPGERPPR
jgi:hypothetical protein